LLFSQNPKQKQNKQGEVYAAAAALALANLEGLLPFLFWQVARTEFSFLNSSIMRIPTPVWGLTGLGGLGSGLEFTWFCARLDDERLKKKKKKRAL
jgi:hypothetical protein